MCTFLILNSMIFLKGGKYESNKKFVNLFRNQENQKKSHKNNLQKNQALVKMPLVNGKEV